MDLFPHFNPAELDSVMLRSLWLNLITARSLPLSLNESGDLRTLLHYVNPYANKKLPVTHKTIKRDLVADFNDKKQRIIQTLREAISKVHFSVDGWTSPNQLGVMGVVVHFISKRRKLEHLFLALQELDGTHTGENFAVETIALYDDFDIIDLIGYMQGDNAYSNDTMATWIDEELGLRGTTWTGNKYRMRCTGHIINLSVMAFLGALAKELFDFDAVAVVSRMDDVNSNEVAIDGISTFTSMTTRRQGKKKTTKKEDYKDSVEYKRWRKLGPLGVLHNTVIYMQALNDVRRGYKATPRVLTYAGIMLHGGTRGI